MNAEKLLEIQNLAAGYGRRQVLKDISFPVEEGVLTGLLGANGSGKTTLLKAVCHLIPHTGDCRYMGRSLADLSGRERARLISYIPQRSGVRISLPALDVVLMGFYPALGLLEQPSGLQKKQALDALAAAGLSDRAGTDYQTLSEGQKQLCILARAIAEDAPLLLLDEPESALDFSNRHHIMRLLCEMVKKPGKAGLVSLHDPTLALEYCQRLALLKDGVCMDVLTPASDSVSRMEQALSEIYGPLRLKEFTDNEKRRFLILSGL